MQVDAISGVLNHNFFSSSITAGDKNGFEKLLNNEIREIEKNIENADVGLRKLAVGETDNIHEVMLNISKAQTSFELAVQIRNRVIEGMQEILRMPI